MIGGNWSTGPRVQWRHRHGAIQAEAARPIGNHLVEARPACRVITEAGIQPRVRANLNVRVPELAITCGARDPNDGCCLTR